VALREQILHGCDGLRPVDVRTLTIYDHRHCCAPLHSRPTIGCSLTPLRVYRKAMKHSRET